MAQSDGKLTNTEPTEAERRVNAIRAALVEGDALAGGDASKLEVRKTRTGVLVTHPDWRDTMRIHRARG